MLIYFQVFKDATLFFSRSTPNLAMVIPAMDHIDEQLSNHALMQRFEPAIHAALGLAKKTLNRYYNLTDDAEVYRIAMGKFSFFVLFKVINYFILVLHPHYKLNYFRSFGWEQDWISAAENIVQTEFERTYANKLKSSDATIPPDVLTTVW
jgi:hypothetical protein